MCDAKTWDRIKREYIDGGTSFKKLANKYGISQASIQRKAKSDGWLNLRESIRIKTESQVEAIVVQDHVDRFVKMYGLVDQYQQQLADLMQEPARNGRDAHDLGDALLDAVQLIRDLYGLPNEQQRQGRERLAIMREDLKIRQADQARANGDDAPVQRWVIEMGGDGDE